eukprot:6121837-Pyramimonas_sp.AAC.1
MLRWHGGAFATGSWVRGGGCDGRKMWDENFGGYETNAAGAHGYSARPPVLSPLTKGFFEEICHAGSTSDRREQRH